MSLWNLVTNTVEGAAQTTIGAAKTVASPVTYWIKEDAVEDAMETTSKGIEKIGKDS